MPSVPLDNNSVIARFRGGDPEAFEDLYREFAPRTVLFLLARLGCRATAEDLSQILWMKIWKKRESFDGQHFNAWVFQIARRLMIDHFRKTKRDGKSAASAKLAGRDSSAASMNDPTERDEELAALRECLSRLGNRLLQVITRVKLDGEPPQDVAATIGTSRGQIDKDVFRAKQQLRECLEKKRT